MSPDSAPPAFLSRFVGREAELAAVAGALAGARLVTLAGPGGCGKTRLAARVAEQVAGDRPDGARWADLTATTAPSAVVELVARALGVLVPDEQDAIPALAAQVAGRRVLLCLDNCEHVRAAAADVAAAVLRAGREVTVLATSREPLGVPGELVWRVPPLRTEDAVALFHDRAGRVPDGAGDASAVRTACARLDGMPLGVELAAAWSGTLSPQEIVAGLDDRFRLLIRGPHGVAARHQTLAASMDWSHDLLDEADRVLFRRLAVFHGGFTAAAARGLAGADVLDGLRRLIDKSLLVADLGSPASGSATRYRMLETVREYAAARLAASGEHDEIRDRHLDVQLATAESVRHLLDEDKDAWRAAVGGDYENLRAAVEWGLGRADGRGRALAAELAWFWHVSPRGVEGLELLRRAVELGAGERSALQARLLTGLSLVADTAGPRESGYDAARAAMEIADDAGDPRTACLARQLAAVGRLGSDLDGAADLASAAETTACEIGYGFGRDGARVVRGIVQHLRDRHEDAVPLLRSAVEGLLPRGDREVAAAALGFLARSAAETGDLAAARAWAHEAVAVAAPLGDVHRVGSAHAVLALVEGLAGRTDEAWRALDPVLRLVDDPARAPYVPGLPEVVGLLHLRAGRPDLALAAYARERPQHLTPRCWTGRATALARTGDHGAAAEQAELAVRVGRAVGMPGLVADGLAVLAELAEPAEPDRAEDLHHEALALRAEHGLRPACVAALEAIARLAGPTAEAARLLGACDRARAELGLPPRPGDPGDVDEQARAEGRELTLEAAVAYARRSRGARSRPASGWNSLTPTERSVVALAVEGLTNPDIGRRLFMSRATVKTHLSHVYAKLGVANRTELATAAREAPAPR